MKTLKVKERTRDILIKKYTADFNKETAGRQSYIRYNLQFSNLDVTITRDISFTSNDKYIIKVECRCLNNTYEQTFNSSFSGLLAACNYVDSIRVNEAKKLIYGL